MLLLDLTWLNFNAISASDVRNETEIRSTTDAALDHPLTSEEARQMLFTAEELSASLAKAREAARYGRARGHPQSKHWTWLFRALWSGLKAKKVHLSVPDTFLWENGWPTRWLATDDRGFLVRKEISSKPLETVRNALAVSAQPRFFCVAEYVDGVREELTVNQFDSLVDHREWRIQVRVIQARLSATRLETGTYVRDAPTSLVPRAEAAAKAAAELASSSTSSRKEENISDLARALAKFAEATYTPTSKVSDVLPSDQGVEIDRLVVEGIVDCDGKLWIVRATDLRVVFVNHAPAREDAEREKARNRARNDALEWTNHLRRLIQLAAKRGVAFEACYAHFDSQSKGFVDENQLKDALELLGIIDEKRQQDEQQLQTVVQLVLKNISGGDSTFSQEDLWNFAGFKGSFTHSQISVQKNSRLDDHKDPEDASWRQRARQMLRASNAGRSHRLVSVTTGRIDGQEESKEVRSIQERIAAPARDAKKKDHPPEDPLGHIPGARPKTRRAMEELMEAARRNRRVAKPRESSPSSEPTPRPDKAIPPPTVDASASSIAIEKSLSGDDSDVNHASISETTASVRDTSESSSRDSFFHVEPGLVMTYRIVRGLPHMDADNSDSANVLAQATSARDSEIRIRGAGTVSSAQSRFLLIALPDFFQTLDTLEAALRPVLVHHHGNGDALLVGLPGLPHTCWPPHTALNNSLHADCLRRLLAHLVEFGHIPSPLPERRHAFFIGFGNGACALARFMAASAFSDEQNCADDHVQATAAAVMVNSFFACEGPVSRSLKTLMKVYARGSHEERLEALVDTHFSNTFLNTEGRDGVLRSFWSTRADLTLEETIQAPGFSVVGLCAMLRGAIAHQDIRGHLSSIPVPLVLLQSARNRLVPPQRAPEDLAASRSNEQSFSATAAEAVVSDNGRGAHVVYVDAGHEILLERGSYFASLLSEILCAGMPSLNAVGVVQSRQTATTDPHGVDRRDSLASSLFGALHTEISQEPCAPPESHRQSEPMTNDASVVGEKCELVKGANPSHDNSQRDDCESSPTSLKVSSNDEMCDEEKGRTSNQIQRNSAKRLRQQKESASSRTERIEKEQIKQEVEKLREEQSLEAIKAAQVRERFAMRAEDLHSHEAREYAADQELYQGGMQKALERAQFLASARDAEERMELDDCLKRERTIRRIEARDKEFMDETRALQESAALDLAENLSGNDESPFMLELARAARNNMDELLANRQQLIQALQRCSALEKTVEQFSQKLEAVDKSARRIHRTLKLLETNADLKSSLAPSQQEADDLAAAHVAKTQEQSQLRQLVQHRSRKLGFANLVAQTLKSTMTKKEEGARTFASRLSKLAQDLRQNRGSQRLLKSQLEQQASKQHAAIKHVRKRIEAVGRELARLRNHTGEYVNCDVWSHGYMCAFLCTNFLSGIAGSE